MQDCTSVLSSQAILFDDALFMYLWSEGMYIILLMSFLVDYTCCLFILSPITPRNTTPRDTGDYSSVHLQLAVLDDPIEVLLS